jgi:hypothetical protein
MPSLVYGSSSSSPVPPGAAYSYRSNDMNEIDIYSNGICYCSVCSNINDINELTKLVNIKNPTGILSKWKLANEYFKEGQKNPHICNKDNTKKHYLFAC